MQTTPVMSQAKTLTPEEVSQVLDFIATQNYPLRNRVMLLTGLWSGMRVGEIASLRIQDLLNADGTVRATPSNSALAAYVPRFCGLICSGNSTPSSASAARILEHAVNAVTPYT